jgi:hypothetical protein
VNETAGTATVTVTRTQGDVGVVSVNYALTDGSATAGADYTTAAGTLTFLDKQTTATFVVPILDDTIAEGDETINITLSAPHRRGGDRADAHGDHHHCRRREGGAVQPRRLRRVRTLRHRDAHPGADRPDD